MRKSSLGRRSSSLRPHKSLTSSEGIKKERTSGIPVRTTSYENLVFPEQHPTSAVKQCKSRTGNAVTPVSNKVQERRLTVETLRPSRPNTQSASSSRASSYGGSKTKRDNRPIQEKEWQLTAQKRIEDIIKSDPDGAEILMGGSQNNSLKPISLKLFIDLLNFFLSKLDSDISVLDKHNYINEIPFLCKLMNYKGRIDKSWLISVNTQHSWPHVLGLLHFFALCVECQNQIDPLDLMYPDSFNTFEVDDSGYWNFKDMLPYAVESYKLHLSNHPDYQTLQKNLDEELLSRYYQNGLFERVMKFQEDTKMLQEEYDNMKAEKEGIIHEISLVEKDYNFILDDINRAEDYQQQIEAFNQQLGNSIEQKALKLKGLQDFINAKKTEKLEIAQRVHDQTLTLKDIEEIKRKRESLQRDIESEQKYIQELENVVYEEDLNVLSLKDGLLKNAREYNVKLAKYLNAAPEIETAKLPSIAHEMDQEIFEESKKILLELKEKYINVLRNIEITIKEKNSVLKEEKEKNISLENSLKEKSKINAELKKDVEMSKQIGDKELAELKATLKEIEGKCSKLTQKVPEDLSEKLVEKRKIVSEMERETERYEEDCKKLILACRQIFSDTHLQKSLELKKKLLDQRKERKGTSHINEF